jgi:hypothetical protein
LLYLNFGPAVQVEPSYSSVAPVVAVADYHQKLKLLFVFLLLLNYLAVFKFPPAVQVFHHILLLHHVKLQDCIPPKAKAAV